MKKRVLLSLDEEVHTKFKKIAGRRYVSTMVEDFMKQVISENTKKKTQKSRRLKK